jgi:hypothetical protein
MILFFHLAATLFLGRKGFTAFRELVFSLAMK